MIRVQKTRDIERMRILAGLEDSREANGLLKESVVPTNSILGESTDSDLEDMYGEDGDDLEECGDSLGSDMIDEEGYVDDEDDFDTSFEDSVVSRASRDKKARRAAEKDDFVDDDDDDDPGFVDPEDMDDDEVPGDTKMGKASGSDVYNKLPHSDTIEIYADDDQLNKFTLNEIATISEIPADNLLPILNELICIVFQLLPNLFESHIQDLILNILY